MTQRYFSILDRYIAKELLFTWLGVVLVLVLILISTTLASLLGQAANGAIPDDAILPLLSMTGLRSFISISPLALYLAVLLTFSRLYKDNEMAAMNACGISLMRLYRSLMILVIPVSLMVLILTLFVRPWIVQQADQFKREVENRSDLSGLVAGQFNKTDRATMFLEKLSDNGRKMENVFLRQKNENSTGIETSRQLQRYEDKQGRSFIVFVDGQYYNGEAGRSDYTITHYKKHGVYVPNHKQVQQRMSGAALSSKELWHSKNSWQQAELQWRIAMPVLTFLMAVLALPLSYTTPRKGRYSKLALAIFIYLVYANLTGIAQTWVEQQKVPQWLGMWWIHSFIILLIIILLIKRYGGMKSLLNRYLRTAT